MSTKVGHRSKEGECRQDAESEEESERWRAGEADQGTIEALVSDGI